MTIVSTTVPFRVVIVGCSYAGLSTAVSLLDLAAGKSPRFSAATTPPYTHHSIHTHVPIDITMIDERDGYCEYRRSFS